MLEAGIDIIAKLDTSVVILLFWPYGAHGGPAVGSLVAHLQRKALAVVGLNRPGSFEGTRTHIAASLRIVPA
jgi:hypothetical protein